MPRKVYMATVVLLVVAENFEQAVDGISETLSRHEYPLIVDWGYSIGEGALTSMRRSPIYMGDLPNDYEEGDVLEWSREDAIDEQP